MTGLFSFERDVWKYYLPVHMLRALDYYFLPILYLGKTELIPGSEGMNQELTGWCFLRQGIGLKNFSEQMISKCKQSKE
jgi:hypothetical protein